MIEHLPECFEQWQIARKCNICDALRACEERVRGEEQQRIEAALRSVGQHDAAWELAIRERTLRDAREAIIAAKSLNVASSHALDKEARFIWMNHALEAIDALREETND
jgi:hypothetical protein